ncbi:MAG: hypothetical protein Q4P24_07415 [Rhodobacterales bacterium]|nr:hypothetical protein [Rhodobacterales bacterium]
MTNPHRTCWSSGKVARVIAAATIASLAPNIAAADDYDIDCKLILCLPAGFPSVCQDAYKHMVNRLRNGKSPIGFCAMSDGTEYDAYDIDHRTVPATSKRGWECAADKNLYHTAWRNGDDKTTQVQTFCYDKAYAYSDGEQRFTNVTRPTRMDFEVNLTVEPGTPDAFSQGWQRFEADIGNNPSTSISYRP